MKQRWLDSAVFYEVYPTSFYDANGDGVGDISGIIEKLDYISDLGCNAIWLNPHYTSPFMDGGYDVSDYYNTDPRFGTNEDMKRLFDTARKRALGSCLISLWATPQISTRGLFNPARMKRTNILTHTFGRTTWTWSTARVALCAGFPSVRICLRLIITLCSPRSIMAITKRINHGRCL